VICVPKEKEMSDIANHRRVNDILLGPLERPTLKWLAAHMPAWVMPDTCTLIGVAGAMLVGASYVLSNYHPGFLWLASLGFVINWFGDSLDGTLARHRKIERPVYGFFVDHVTDAFSVTVIMIGLGLTPYVGFIVACLTLISYLLLSVLVFVRTSVVGEFKISYSKLGPTEIRAFAVLLNAAMFFGGVYTSRLPLGGLGQLVYTPYDLILGVLVLLMLYFFFTTGLKETVRLARENR
jgi:phosphatidylglycerophosphate synthase